MTRLNTGSSTRPLLAPFEARGDGKASINSFVEKEYDGTDSERRLLLTRTSSSDRVDNVRAQSHYQTFEAFGDVSHYKPVEQYEGIHRYDPKFAWRPKEERKLVRKVCACLPLIAREKTDTLRCSWICAYVRGCV